MFFNVVSCGRSAKRALFWSFVGNLGWASCEFWLGDFAFGTPVMMFLLGAHWRYTTRIFLCNFKYYSCVVQVLLSLCFAPISDLSRIRYLTTGSTCHALPFLFWKSIPSVKTGFPAKFLFNFSYYRTTIASEACAARTELISFAMLEDSRLGIFIFYLISVPSPFHSRQIDVCLLEVFRREAVQIPYYLYLLFTAFNI